MRVLSDIPNTDAPSGDYPGGRIRNKDNTAIPPIVGTPVIEQLYGDIVQFFQRLLVLGSVTANGLADNVTNGFQTITALWNAILSRFAASDAETISGGASDKFVTPQGLSAKTALETRRGIIELATPSEVLPGTDNERAVTSAGLAAKDGGLITTVINIGDWNMDVNAFVQITHSISLTKIRSIDAIIRNDADNSYYNLMQLQIADGTMAGGFGPITSTYVELTRTTGRIFDSPSFDSTSYNRGWVIIKYIP